ncbi:MAG: PspA/IM30 family protein [Candidatus Methanoliparum thermophilum]|uniref:PspA/IM30 family protein n=1 Tax=Methanoliparum thermophilum TaxID=2491083 RepID=A0A520KSK2_METT2|nr:MAG: PspA/IM30 family protein [Candidatus Methanoliparum thermophilum]
MGIFKRASTIIKAKIDKIMNNFEDPREMLDYSYRKQLELLQQIKRNIASIITARKRLELQKNKIEEEIKKLDRQAKDSLKAGREDLARLAIKRKKEYEIRLDDLSKQIEISKKEEEKLVESEKKLSAKIETFRSEKEIIKAKYSSAEAEIRVKEAIGGISEEMADVGFAMERAREKTEEMVGRSEALDEMEEIGVIDMGENDIERELRETRLSTEVEEEMERLKKEVNDDR